MGKCRRDKNQRLWVYRAQEEDGCQNEKSSVSMKILVQGGGKKSFLSSLMSEWEE